ncbi:MAG: SDR family NAD(P)-dependent oxidoreductase [Candidatus Dormibacteria bacterium]
MEVAGRVVVVTGGGSGIGAAIARALHDAGAATVVVADRDGAAAEAVAAEVGGVSATVDVSREAGVRSLVEGSLAAHGRVDLYVSNAGVARGGGPEAPDDDWDLSWRVHVMAHVWAARALLPVWAERGEGYLVGTVSAAGLLNHVLAAPYGTTKAAGLSFLEWLAIAHGDDGIRVSAICPQGVRTPMLENAADGGFLWDSALSPAAVADATLGGIREERFLILPDPSVSGYAARRGADHEAWLRGMRRLRAHALRLVAGQPLL